MGQWHIWNSYLRDTAGGSSWRLGSEEGPGVFFHHTPTSKKKFGKPKK
jgi:hypothetical protein